MSLSRYASKAVLNSFFGKTSSFGALASAPTIYVGLSKTAPSETGTNISEPSTGGYTRVATTAASWAAATDTDPPAIANSAAVNFPKATAAWGDLTYFVLMDAATAGNMLGYDQIKGSQSGAAITKTVTEDDTPSFAAGSLTTYCD